MLIGRQVACLPESFPKDCEVPSITVGFVWPERPAHLLLGACAHNTHKPGVCPQEFRSKRRESTLPALLRQQPEQRQDSCPCCSMFSCSKASAADKAGVDPPAPSQRKQQEQQLGGLCISQCPTLLAAVHVLLC